jgi:hypothetical protein
VQEIKRRGAEGNSLLEHGEDPCFFLLSPPLFFLSVGMGGWSRASGQSSTGIGKGWVTVAVYRRNLNIQQPKFNYSHVIHPTSESSM